MNCDDKGPQNANYHEESKEPVQFRLDPNMDIDTLTCPITMEPIEEPASTLYGHLFEMSAIR